MKHETKERCEGCKYARCITSNGNWQFTGCYHSPHVGKWVKEIKDCPMGKENKYAKTLCL